MEKCCGFSLKMCWSINSCSKCRTQILWKCISGTAQPAEAPPLVLALSSQFQNYWFKHSIIDYVIQGWVKEGACSQLWYYGIQLHFTWLYEAHYLFVSCCGMRLKHVFRWAFGPWQVKHLGLISSLKPVAQLYEPCTSPFIFWMLNHNAVVN